jgi:hypothetical protein
MFRESLEELIAKRRVTAPAPRRPQVVGGDMGFLQRGMVEGTSRGIGQELKKKKKKNSNQEGDQGYMEQDPYADIA